MIEWSNFLYFVIEIIDLVLYVNYLSIFSGISIIHKTSSFIFVPV